VLVVVDGQRVRDEPVRVRRREEVLQREEPRPLRQRHEDHVEVR